MRIRSLFVAAGMAALVACGSSQAPTSQLPTPSMPESPSPTMEAPSASPTPSAAAATPAPTTIQVAFSGLPNGTYPVHIHSICNGSQAFHIAVVQSLTVSRGAGAISVPSGYFGRGLCVIVYTSPSLVAVLTTRRI